MFKIPINGDIESYSEGIICGLSIKEIKKIAIVIVTSVLSIFLLSRVFPIIVAVYLSTPIIGIIAMSGKQTGNMSFEELLKYQGIYRALKKGIGYESTENPDKYMEETNERRTGKRGEY